MVRHSREFCPTPGVAGLCEEWCGTHCGPKCCASDRELRRQARESISLHTAADGQPAPRRSDPLLPSAGSRRARAMLWQGEKNTVGRLGFMYWPVMSTLLEGFRHTDAAVAVGVGFSLAYHEELARLRRGDMLVWVGINGRNSQPWRELRSRGVRTVYYNTEPVDAPGMCVRGHVVDEVCSSHAGLCTAPGTTQDPARPRVFLQVWDFSHFNLERCARRSRYGKPPRRQRFVPPGYVRSALPVRDGASRSLLFFGALAPAGRGACFGALKSRLGARLQRTYAVWNASALDDLMRRYDVFLNLHKGCATRGPVTFRNAVLLNAAKLVLSERAHPADEREYEGMLTFAEQPAIVAAYERLLASDVRAARYRAHAIFARRFAPRALFERAGIYAEWNRSASGGS